MKFRDLLEKIQSTVTEEWYRLELDNGDVLLTNIKLLSKHKLQINKNNENIKTILYKDNDVIKTIENELGYKLDKSNKDVQEFLKMFPRI